MDALSIYHLVALLKLMIAIDSSILQFKGNDLAVMLYLLTHANKEGVCEVSYSILSEELGLSIQSCRTAINHLKVTSKLTSKSTSKKSYITICKYESYCTEYNSEQQANQQALQQAKIDELMAKIAELEMQIEKGKKRKKKETLPMSADDAIEKLKERALVFYNSLIPYVDSRGGKYPKEMIRAFYNYWSEPNKSRTKMRLEMEKTWELGRRLATWANNNKTFKYQNRDEQRIDDVQRRQESAAGIIARLAAEENDDNQ